ncbi:hypothetical protein IMG5_110920 [Ichthyophthirius multifiliis]|uniref:C1q domain-containing protein n=1 Tax=Ichthyophthirius multifiliis TaxID=5932 RepID=G0QTR6_ICHMU|nr:hypothetical protein IMG5_110920 [Ichthyophthirius multifiliis]EGR31387.1 hypothetical protein IMG5_110920 [Ichthyophthirius multifiliis]|eukprot:XP_004034873.1 hypothetical protein IMG5_110920 [Ichthyophthirius multifiliis]
MEISLQKLEKSEFLEALSNQNKILDQKTDISEVQNALNQCQQDMSERFLEFQEEIKGIILQNMNENVEILDKKANLCDVQLLLKEKADLNTIQALVSTKVSAQEVEDLRIKSEKAYKECENKLNSKHFEQIIKLLQGQIEQMQKDLLQKGNIKDFCAILDTKTSINDVNNALQQIHKELEKKAFQDDVNTCFMNQNLLNSQYSAENMLIKLAWKSGELKIGQFVPWENEISNYFVENFSLEREKTTINVLNGGFYQIYLAFFAKKKPTIQILINGEPIMSAVNTSSYVLHHSSGKLKDIKHTNGNVTGLTLIDFLNLPNKCKISVTFSGENSLENLGFITLKKI